MYKKQMQIASEKTSRLSETWTHECGIRSQML